jgi:Fur family ferric uptake transcriptional regulator
LSHPPESIESLRKRGVRITPQREAVLCALYALGGHVTAETVYEAVCKGMPYVGLATVYRNLEFLKEQGVVVATDLGDGRMEWELTVNGPHHHAVCRVCGDVIQLDDALVRELGQKLRDELGFEADLSHMAFFGMCAECQSETDS